MTGKRTILLFEFLCSGVCADQPLPDSLLAEGRLMWQALAEDLLASEGIQVVSTWDDRLAPPPLPGLTLHSVCDTQTAEAEFRRLATAADQVIVIAPELDRALEQRVELLEQLGRGELMSTPAAVRLAADKWECFRKFQAHNIPTPATVLIDQPGNDVDSAHIPFAWPWIVKPRWGAGATATYRVETAAAWRAFQAEAGRTASAAPFQPYLIQPWDSGIPVSLHGMVHPRSGELCWLPLGLQQFAPLLPECNSPQALQYLGGSLPADRSLAGGVDEVAAAVVAAVPGLRGYFGLDLLVDPTGERPPQVLDLNPRLTTSYLGYRALAENSLVPWLLGDLPADVPRFRPGQVRFDVAGQLHFG